MRRLVVAATANSDPIVRELGLRACVAGRIFEGGGPLEKELHATEILGPEFENTVDGARKWAMMKVEAGVGQPRGQSLPIALGGSKPSTAQVFGDKCHSG